MGPPPPLSLSKAVRLSLSEQGRRHRFGGPNSKRKDSFQPGHTLGDCAWAEDRSKVPPGAWCLFQNPGPRSALAPFCTSLQLHLSSLPGATSRPETEHLQA